ncbi:MAG: hypothetical protein DRO87_04265 [Candidatus Thorarchaeota archaeon]|nr:MAG: hypothetical protein DRP09_09305 [Candidatus Thorarchaeota archaeon]RLI58978.1 MAG: hypothetical protein DRO87_04265 [Candidatus Thorarchaeota archaeon]
MYQRYSTNPDNATENVSSDSPSLSFLTEAKEMTEVLRQYVRGNCSRQTLLERQQAMSGALDSLWSDVESGSISVGSVALLRTLKTLSCPEIARRLGEPDIDHNRVMRDLQLLINSFQYIIKPKRVV